MNQIYACREGRKETFTDAKISGTATTTPTRSVRRTILSKLLLGVFLFLVAGAVEVAAQTRTYNTNGVFNFVVPPGVNQITFDVTGAGGGGAGGNHPSGSGGGGGGGGSFRRYTTVSVVPGQTLAITIGQGGPGGGFNTPGTAGGVTSVVALTGPAIGAVINHPGAAGGTVNAGGAGATMAGGSDGGNGGDAATAVNQAGGGGGGEAAANAANGNPGGVGSVLGAGGIAGTGGPGADGGAGGTVPWPGVNPAPGVAPGGGGGGGGADFVAAQSQGGSAGGDGQVVVSYACPTYTLPVIGTVTSNAAIGAFCQGDAAVSVTGPGTVPLGTAALAGLSPFYTVGYGAPFPATGGPVLSGTNVVNNAPGYSFNPTTPGCFVVTYSYADPNPLVPAACGTSATRTVLVYPTHTAPTPGADVCAGTNLNQPTGLPALPAGFKFQWFVDRCATPANVNIANWTDAFPATSVAGIYSIKYRIVTDGSCPGVPANIVSPLAGCQESAAVIGRVFPSASVLVAGANVCAGTNLPTPTGVTAPPAGFKVQWFIDRCNEPGGPVNVANWTDAPFPAITTAGTYRIKSRYVTDASCFGGAANVVAPAGCLESAFVNENIFPGAPVIAANGNVCAGTNLPTPTGVAAAPPGFKVQWLVQLCGGGAAVWTDAPFSAINTAGVYTIRARYVTNGNCFGVAANIVAPVACEQSNAVNEVVFPNPLPVLAAPGDVCFGTAIAQPAIPAALPGFKIQWNFDNAGWVNTFTPPTAVGCHTIKARYVTDGTCGSPNEVAPPVACAETNTVNALIYPQPVIVLPITPTCTPAGFAPVMQNNAANVAAGFTPQFSSDGGATWWTGASPVTNSGCYTVIGRWVNTNACGLTPALTPGPGACAASAPANVLIYPVAPVINPPATTCAPTQFTLPPVPNQAPDFTTQWSIVPTGNLPNWQFFPAIPTTPGVYDIQARYVNSAICGTIAAGTAGPNCSITNITQATINSVPVVTAVANLAPVCCNTNIGPFNFTLANLPMLPAGGVLTWNWTNSNPAIGLAAFGAGSNIPAFVAACNPTTQFATITVTATYTFAGQSCTSAPMQFTITVNANVTGTINGPNVSICAGQSADINIDLTGVPNFSGNLAITVQSGIGAATGNLAFGPAAPVGGGAGPLPAVTVNGPSAITIPAAFLTNNSANTTVYRVSWNSPTSLVDANGCVPNVGSPLTGFQDITVYPLPTINAVLTTVAPAASPTMYCPGTTLNFNVTNPNVIPGTLFNWTAVDNNGAGVTLGSANNVAFGSPALSTSLGLTCPITHTNPIRFRFTPIGPGPLGCVGSFFDIFVNIGDVTPPIWTSGNGNATLECSDAAGIAAARAFVPTASNNNCTGVTVTAGTETFVPSCGHTGTYAAGKTGTLTTIFTATEPCGATNTITQVITINDTQAPTWTTAVGALNTTIECTNNAAAFAAQLAAAQAFVPVPTDNCTPVSATAGFPGSLTGWRVKTAGVFAQAVAGTCVSEGTYTNTFVTRDACGNSSVVYTQVITIEDNTAPSLSNPGTQTVNVGAGVGCMAPLPDFRGLVTYTDCTPISPAGLIQTPAPGTMVVGAAGPGPVGGSVTVQITAQDGCGNSTTITFLANITDATPPIARCHNVTIDLDATGNATMVPSFIDGNKNGVAGNGTTTPAGNPWILSSDNCGVQFVRFTPANTGLVEPFPAAEGNSNVLRVFKCNDVGANNITLEITDYNGNVTTCPSVVTVRDVTKPVITCAPTQTFQKNATCVTILPNLIGVGLTTATDACGIASITQTPAAGSIIAADVASLVVTFEATDVNGNTQVCTSTMLFRDQTPPVITGCPAPITVFTGAGNTDCQVTVAWAPPTASDNCSPILGNTILTSTHQPAGASTTSSPNGGAALIPDNSSAQSVLNVSGIPAGSTVQSVTINGINHGWQSDIDIALTSPGGTTVILMSDIGTSQSLTGQTYTFRDGLPATGGLANVANPTGSYFPTNNGAGDPFPAPANGPVATTITAGFGAGNQNGNWTLTLVDDEAIIQGSITNWSILFNTPAGGTPFFVGTTNVVYTATDAAGNTTTCTFPVTVIDNTLPVITCNNTVNQVVNATASCQYTHSGTGWDASGTDNCIPIIQATYQLTGATNVPYNAANTSLNGRSFNLGTTTVTWRVVDQSTNSTTCSFTVTVVDTQVPSLTCPANVAINSNTTNCAAVVPVGSLTPVFSDNCAVTLVEWSVSGATPISSGIGSMGNYTFSLGTSLVTFRVHDAAGNSTLCTFNVVVTNALAGAISGNATAAQNAMTTSTVTFTGSGAPASPTTTYTFGYNVNGGPTQFVTTGAGSTVVTVAQSNAVVGTFVYTLTSVTANNMPGCAGAITAPPTATINVVFGQPDLTNSQFFSTTQIAAGGVIDEVVSIRNVGTAATSGPIVFTVTNYAAITGLSAVSNTNPSVTIGFTTYPLNNASWTITSSPSALTFTSNVGVVINPGAQVFLGVRINRAAGANGTVTHSSTITGGTGGGETPTNNNSISNTLLKN